MERQGSEGFGGRRRRLVKNEVPIAPPRPLRRTSSLPAAAKPPPPEVKLAAVAVDLNVRLRSADMSPAMQERAFRFARFLLDAHSDNVPPPTQLAMRLKKEFDGLYGPAWHCIVGKSFGSFVTHSSGGFVYFSIDKLSFLLFKTEGFRDSYQFAGNIQHKHKQIGNVVPPLACLCWEGNSKKQQTTRVPPCEVVVF